MNQEIKELAEQAKLFTGWPNGETEYQKFAELLIKECAELATKEYNNHGSLHGNDLLEHFGVEL